MLKKRLCRNEKSHCHCELLICVILRTRENCLKLSYVRVCFGAIVTIIVNVWKDRNCMIRVSEIIISTLLSDKYLKYDPSSFDWHLPLTLRPIMHNFLPNYAIKSLSNICTSVIFPTNANVKRSSDDKYYPRKSLSRERKLISV